jgi:hypothetical protein
LSFSNKPVATLCLSGYTDTHEWRPTTTDPKT